MGARLTGGKSIYAIDLKKEDTNNNDNNDDDDMLHRDGCVYTKERRPNDLNDDPSHYCFALNDQYTAQCQDRGTIPKILGPRYDLCKDNGIKVRFVEKYWDSGAIRERYRHRSFLLHNLTSFPLSHFLLQSPITMGIGKLLCNFFLVVWVVKY